MNDIRQRHKILNLKQLEAMTLNSGDQFWWCLPSGNLPRYCIYFVGNYVFIVVNKISVCLIQSWQFHFLAATSTRGVQLSSCVSFTLTLLLKRLKRRAGLSAADGASEKACFLLMVDSPTDGRARYKAGQVCCRCVRWAGKCVNRAELVD